VRHEIILSPQAIADLKRLPARTRAELRDQIEFHLRHEPTKGSRSRIKRLRGLRRPQFRLRVGDIRVFYDVEETEVQILTIVTKEQANAWLRTSGVPE
jgi:mRNA interferase RelE/StbE